MLDEDKTTESRSETPAANVDEAAPPPAKKAAAKKTAAKKTTARKTTAKKATAKTTAKKAAEPAADETGETGEIGEIGEKPVAKKATRKTAAKKTQPETQPEIQPESQAPVAAPAEAEPPPTMLLFQAPEPTKAPTRRTRKVTVTTQTTPQTGPDQVDKVEQGAGDQIPEQTPDQAPDRAETKPGSKRKSGGGSRSGRSGRTPDESDEPKADLTEEPEEPDESAATEDNEDGDESGGARRRRRRGGRRRRKSGEGDDSDDSPTEGAQRDKRDKSDESADSGDGTATADGRDNGDESTEGSGSRRRRRRRRPGDDDAGEAGGDPEKTVTRVRKTRNGEDQITAVTGSTRLEAKKQRRREGREAGRRRAPIVSEAEFLARRESVERVMVIRQREDLTQIAVIEDKVLVEHYVARESQTSLIGNVYVGRVQNVLPSMEAAFIDIGKGRNAVLYAGEVNWSALGHRDGQPRKIESVLSSGQAVLVQVTKDPMGHKGARLTSQVSLAGRFLVYVPDGTTSGISRKLPDTERTRLKTLLKEIVPDTAGVIVRTAAEGASEEELTHDVERLKARWEDIEKRSKSGSSPKLLYGEPDLTLKVVRDLFTEDFTKLVIEGDDAWDTVHQYVVQVAPDLESRLERYAGNGDAFSTYRIDEQIAKGLDRKVWLPSGGSLVIDRTEAMTVVDVNTGKFTGSGGNLEETVTKNNLEAAEEIVRQLRLRDIGGIIVVDFIDMVLESNRDLVLRRLVECLGRDRTRHQVAEVTSLGLVQMTRKRIGTGLLEAFSENCEHCQGRGIVTHDAPVESKGADDDDSRRGGRRSRGRGRDGGSGPDAGTPGRGQGGSVAEGAGGKPSAGRAGSRAGGGSQAGRDRAACGRAWGPGRDSSGRSGETEPGGQAETPESAETAPEPPGRESPVDPTPEATPEPTSEPTGETAPEPAPVAPTPEPAPSPRHRRWSLAAVDAAPAGRPVRPLSRSVTQRRRPVPRQVRSVPRRPMASRNRFPRRLSQAP